MTCNLTTLKTPISILVTIFPFIFLLHIKTYVLVKWKYIIHSTFTVDIFLKCYFLILLLLLPHIINLLCTSGLSILFHRSVSIPMPMVYTWLNQFYSGKVGPPSLVFSFWVPLAIYSHILTLRPFYQLFKNT